MTNNINIRIGYKGTWKPTDNFDPDKYRWHDLRKNPKDLPNDGDYIMCCYYCILTAPTIYEIGEYTSFGKVFPNSDNYDFDYWYVRAWREIEPFEEDNDEH